MHISQALLESKCAKNAHQGERLSAAHSELRRAAIVAIRVCSGQYRLTSSLCCAPHSVAPDPSRFSLCISGAHCTKPQQRSDQMATCSIMVHRAPAIKLGWRGPWSQLRPRACSHISTAVRRFSKLTHTDQQGKATMVDISGKPDSERTATAEATVLLGPTAFECVRDNAIKKGDVLAVARLAGIMGAKQTSNLIPLCHNINIKSVRVDLALDESRHAVHVTATAKTVGSTGVEMEALTAATIAGLTVYDMCKAVTHDITISDVRLVSKTGGVRGDFARR